MKSLVVESIMTFYRDITRRVSNLDGAVGIGMSLFHLFLLGWSMHGGFFTDMPDTWSRDSLKGWGLAGIAWLGTRLALSVALGCFLGFSSVVSGSLPLHKASPCSLSSRVGQFQT